MLPTDLSASKENKNFFTTSKSQENGDKSAPKAAGRWTKEEHQRFIDGLKKFGKNWKQIEDYVGSRSGSQIRSHAQKYFLKIGKDIDCDNSDQELPPPRKDAPEPMRKESDGSTNCSQQAVENLCNDTKSIQEQLDLIQRIETPVNKAPVTASSTLSIPISNTNRLEELYGLGNLPSRTRKMSIDVSTVKPYTNPLLELFLSNIRTSENGFQMPKLTEIVELGPGSRQRAFSNLTETSLLSNHLINNNFGYNNIPRLNSNPRKFSEDNILIQNRLGQPSQNNPSTNWSEFEVLTKKIKKL